MSGQTDRPVLVDLYGGLGGAGVGYQRAGFDVVSVDIAPQPDNPLEFVQEDALAYLDGLIRRGAHLTDGRRVAAVHASCPCQSSSGPTKGSNRARNEANGHHHPELIPPTRARLEVLGLPYVLENVVQSELRPDVILCGLQFGLRVFRHRVFELGRWDGVAPDHPRGLHRGHRVRGWRHGKYYGGDMLAVYGGTSSYGGGKASVDECREALGIDWSRNRGQLVEAIPPAYTEFLGLQLMEVVLDR